VDFIENHQPVFESLQVQARAGQLGAVLLILQIEIQRIPLLAEHPRQRRLPNLAGTDQGDGGLTIQGGLDDGSGMSLD